MKSDQAHGAPTLVIHKVPFDAVDLDGWKANPETLLSKSAAALPIRQVIRRKLKARGGGQRFFGEAFVASHQDFSHRKGWYSSYKWLSARRWRADDAGGRWTSHALAVKKALKGYLGNVAALQESASRLRKKLDGKSPVAPDLWLFTGRRHRFIEVKLPSDRPSDTQLAGLAVLAAARSRHPISVEIVQLVPRGGRVSNWDAALDKFDVYYRELKRR
jgi:hypothetical protein